LSLISASRQENREVAAVRVPCVKPNLLLSFHILRLVKEHVDESVIDIAMPSVTVTATLFFPTAVRNGTFPVSL
jgi:hypothetical protein